MEWITVCQIIIVVYVHITQINVKKAMDIIVYVITIPLNVDRNIFTINKKHKNIFVYVIKAPNPVNQIYIYVYVIKM